jgi:hypothetical protein
MILPFSGVLEKETFTIHCKVQYCLCIQAQKVGNCNVRRFLRIVLVMVIIFLPLVVTQACKNSIATFLPVRIKSNKPPDRMCALWISGHTDSVAALAFSSDGQLLASGGLDGIVNVWESSTGTLRHKLEGPGDAIEVSIQFTDGVALSNAAYFF